ncbi:MAG: site-specific DNA-methyltransferase [Candidatus ainarchaeum sp.]|nr:site-specific DNA-methyltransferase [Candidatus ainarchaeum sp.]
MVDQEISKLLKEINKLKDENQKLKSRKKYGLVWEEEKEPEQVVLDCQKKIPILKEVKSKEILTDKDKPINILIEGDNYHALQVLNYTHKGKVDVIYIDPPYNTGKAKEWKYNDKFIDENDNYKHSKWLNFMNKRLLLAKNLLKNDGVIFISIDDNEVSQLKLLCDEIFGEDNFISKFVWEKNFAPKNDNKYISTSQEYILLYAKQKILFKRNLLERTEEHNKGYSNPDNDPRGNWSSGTMLATTFSEKYVFSIKRPNSTEIYPPKGRCWRYSKDKIQKLLNDNRIWFGKTGSNVPRIKRFLTEVQAGIVPVTLLKYKEVGSGQDGTNDLKNIFGEQIFDFPKPIKLINYILKISSKKNAIILDFFAGTGTTAHSVLDLNVDKGNRKFILCTNNEDNNGDGKKVCSDICYPRIEKAIKGYKTIKNVKVEGMGGNLKYFKTNFIDVDSIYKVSDNKKLNLTYQAGELIAIKEDAFEELEKNEYYQIFKNDKKVVGIYFIESHKKLNELLKKINKYDSKKIIYLFSWGKTEYTGEELGYSNIKIKDIPQPIIDVYKEINKL